MLARSLTRRPATRLCRECARAGGARKMRGLMPISRASMYTQRLMSWKVLAPSSEALASPTQVKKWRSTKRELSRRLRHYRATMVASCCATGPRRPSLLKRAQTPPPFFGCSSSSLSSLSSPRSSCKPLLVNCCMSASILSMTSLLALRIRVMAALRSSSSIPLSTGDTAYAAMHTLSLGKLTDTNVGSTANALSPHRGST
mmetsp:Transcript_99049/g.284746  ORF Transcript_99049/g.284746 Transcript_99049/m.284746 type:complete len:201 (-) Transcript_99049:688-1290(-)